MVHLRWLRYISWTKWYLWGGLNTHRDTWCLEKSCKQGINIQSKKLFYLLTLNMFVWQIFKSSLKKNSLISLFPVLSPWSSKAEIIFFFNFFFYIINIFQKMHLQDFLIHKPRNHFPMVKPPQQEHPEYGSSIFLSDDVLNSCQINNIYFFQSFNCFVNNVLRISIYKKIYNISPKIWQYMLVRICARKHRKNKCHSFYPI